MISVRRIAAAALVAVAASVQACGDGPSGPRTGSLTVNIPDIPAGTSAAVTVTGPEGQPSITVTATRTIPDLTPGIYQITAAKAVGEKSSYTPTIVSQTVEVVAGTTPAAVTVGYTLSTGIVGFTITGVPAGSVAGVTLYNSGGFFVNVTETKEVGNLEPGVYTVQVSDFEADEIYTGSTSQATVTVAASTTPVPIQVTYVARTGTLQISSSGLPEGAVPTWDVIGPSGFTNVVSGTGVRSLSRLVPGQWVVTARNFDFQSETYGALTQSLTVQVVAGGKTPATFNFITRPPTLNVSVDRAYIVQSVQRYAGTVPLVAERGGYLRVFVRANEPNLATPKVRVRFYRGGEIVFTSTINAPGGNVGTTITERTANDSWGLLLPGTLMQPGTSYLVDVDPENTVREVNESDNYYPSSGEPAPLNIRTVPTAEISFVPIVTAANGLVGNVTEDRVPTLLGLALKMFPLSTYSADARAAFTTNAPPLMASDDNGAWVQIINEINVLRISEAAQRNYIGILKVPYSSGIAGLGFIQGRTSLSWDGGGAPTTIAHELGHNWGRFHAPCGNPGGVDPEYPYPGARIGVYGFDNVTRNIVDIALRDVMSYCAPEWVSDYTYEGIMNYRSGASGAMGATVGGDTGPVQSSLIVWGRIVGSKMVLEPAFLTETRRQLPARSGKYRVEGFDEAGAVVFSISFDGEKIEDRVNETTGAMSELGDARQFTFAIPMTPATAARIVSLRLTGDGKEVRVNAAAALGTAATVTATAVGGDNVQLEWNSSDYPMLVVRDPATREILAFARGGSSSVRTQWKSLEIIATDRVHSARLNVQVRQ